MAILELPDELLNTLSNLAEKRNQSIESMIQQLITRDAMFENSLDGLLIVGDDMRYVDVNPAACELLGYTRDELSQKTITDISDPDEQTTEDWETFEQDGKMRGEYILTHKDGHKIFIEFVAINNITPGRHVSIFRDITAHKEMESELYRRDQFLSQIANTLPGIVYVYDLVNHQEVYSNRPVAELLGYSTHASNHKFPHFIETVIHPDDREKIYQHFEALQDLNDDAILENTYRAKHLDGHWLWFNSRDKVAKRDADGNVIQILGIAIDITETERLRVEQQYILDRSPIPIAISTTSEEIEYQNDVFAKTFGYTREDTPDIQTWRMLAYPDPEYRQKSFDQWSKDIKHARQTDNLLPPRLYYIRDKWGEERIVSIQASIIGQRIIASFVDMTEEQRMKQALIESEYRYRALFENALYNIIIYNLDGTIQMINQKAASMFGLKPDEMIGHLPRDFYPEVHEKTIAFINKVVENDTITTIEDKVDINGEMRFLWSIAQPVYDSNGSINSVQIITHDVTAQRQAEAFQQQQKQLEIRLEKERQISDLRTRLLTTISHEFRTPLSVIQTNTEMIMRYRDRLPIERQDQKLNQIITQIRHLVGMLDNVRTMSKAQQSLIDYHPTSVNLSEFIETIRKNFEASKLDTQIFNINIEIDNTTSRFDSNLIKQSIMNLLSNASKYSSEDSTITLTVRQKENSLTFIVMDEGVGMSRNDLHYIYQPFYRGKNVENVRGTGLGLAIVHKIVDLHQGTVSCESQINQGTTFTINLSQNLV